MKRQALRAVIGAAALVALVVAVLAVANWGTVRDHVEAWRFQLTRETKTLLPTHVRWAKGPPYDCSGPTILQIIADSWKAPVIFAPGGYPVTLVNTEADGAKKLLEERGFRIVEQRFPQKAHVVVGDPERSGKPNGPWSEQFTVGTERP
jgi:hypothetical protein